MDGRQDCTRYEQGGWPRNLRAPRGLDDAFSLLLPVGSCIPLLTRLSQSGLLCLVENCFKSAWMRNTATAAGSNASADVGPPVSFILTVSAHVHFNLSQDIH